jgi:HlyD family secretion protein
MTSPASDIRGPALMGVVAIAALVLGFGLWSVLARLHGAVVAQGRLVPEQPAFVLQHPDGGFVREVLVAEGDPVRAGAILLRLDGTALWSELRIVEDRLSELGARVARLTAERDGLTAPAFPDWLMAQAQVDPDVAAQLDGQRTLFFARQATLSELRSQLERRTVQFRARAQGLAAQEVAVGVQRGLLKEDLVDQQQLFQRGLVTEAAYRSIQRESARLDGLAGEVAAALAEVEGQVTETEIQIGSLAAQRREDAQSELREIGPTMLELDERRSALKDRIGRLEIRAPVAGTVFELQIASPGAVLRAAEPALQLVPGAGSLVVLVALPTRHLEQVRPGQSAVVELSSFSTGMANELAGVVTHVSPGLVTDRVTGEAQVMVRIALPAQTGAGPSGQALLPGMPVDVYLRTDDRTPLAYLVAPFTAYFGRALREG